MHFSILHVLPRPPRPFFSPLFPLRASLESAETKWRNVAVLLPQISFQWPVLGARQLWSGTWNYPASWRYRVWRCPLPQEGKRWELRESTMAGFVSETEDCNASFWVLCGGMAGVQSSTSCLHASCWSPHTALLPPCTFPGRPTHLRSLWNALQKGGDPDWKADTSPGFPSCPN